MKTTMRLAGCLGVTVLVAVLAIGGVGAYWWWGRGGNDMIGVGITTSNFFQSAQGGQWEQAHAQLSAPLRESTTPQALAEAWQQHEATYGPLQPAPDLDGQVNPESRTFLVADSTKIAFAEANGTETATFPGTIHFGQGPQEITLRLVKEDNGWRLAELPPMFASGS